MRSVPLILALCGAWWLLAVPSAEAGNPVCACTFDYTPVCSKNGQLFGNACAAKCVGVTDFTNGECKNKDPVLCACNAAGQPPVCANGVYTYDSACSARCAGATLIKPGRCSNWEEELAQPEDLLPGGDTGGDADSGGSSGPVCRCATEPNPVCYKGKTYRNTCFAGCEHGFETKFDNGTCPIKDQCVCPELEVPVCGIDAKTYDNECVASCYGVDVYEQGECTCPCTREFVPVCGRNGKTYPNKCTAECALGKDSWNPGSCEEIKQGGGQVTPGPAGCSACSNEFVPVCGKDGETYPNSCKAECNLGAKSWKAGACPKLPTPINGGNGCDCDHTWEPVCGSDNMTYTSSCVAECILGQGKWKPDVCPSRLCMCSEESFPVCGTDGTTYTNKCKAECKLGKGNWKAGACKKAAPSPSLCICTMIYSPVCGSDKKTYSNSCMAECTLGKGNWKAGACASPTAPPEIKKLGETCPKGTQVACLVNPCNSNKCAAYPGAKCYSNYCKDVLYRGQELAPCAAYWYDPASGDLVNCDLPSVDNIGDCESSVRCAADPCDPKTAKCASNPSATCTPSYCSNVQYRGTPLKPCTPYFLDAKGDVVDCSKKPSPAPATDCKSCPLTYQPVCGADGKTWPSQCAADCSGVKVTRTGKCQHCQGETCKWASKGEICQLGSGKKQCWWKKYDCKVPAGASNTTFGRCIARVGAGVAHHRHLLEEEQ